MLYIILFPAQVLNNIFLYTYVHELGIYFYHLECIASILHLQS